MSAPLPVWSNTIMISATLTTTCTTISKIDIINYFRFWILDFGFMKLKEYDLILLNSSISTLIPLGS
jgi:hypothetical protein